MLSRDKRMYALFKLAIIFFVSLKHVRIPSVLMCLRRILSLTLLCRQPWTVTNSLHIWFFSVFSHQHFDEIQPVISKVTWKRPHLCCKGCSSGLVGRYLIFSRGGKELFPKILSHFPLFLLLFFPFFVFLFIFGGWICYFPPSLFSFFIFILLNHIFIYTFRLCYIYKT